MTARTNQQVRFLYTFLASSMSSVSLGVPKKDQGLYYYYFCKHGLILISPWISKDTLSKLWGEITHPFPNFKGCTVEVWEWISNFNTRFTVDVITYCPACRTSLIATRFWVVMICPIIKCLTVLEFSFILFDLCLFITIFNFILNYVPIVTFRLFTYHKIWILLIIFCFIWNYWIIHFLTCLEVFWSVVS